MNAMRQKAIEGLKEGDTFEIKRTFSHADIVQFEVLSRDHNPVHSNAMYAEAKGFDGVICLGKFGTLGEQSFDVAYKSTGISNR